MIDTHAKPPLNTGLNDRRTRLGMPMRVVAERAGVSLPTVQRIMSGKHENVALGAVIKVARALGAEVAIQPPSATDTEAIRKRQAYAKARRLAAMAQATSALEGQAVGRTVVEGVVERIAHDLLRSRHKLWAAL